MPLLLHSATFANRTQAKVPVNSAAVHAHQRKRIHQGTQLTTSAVHCSMARMGGCACWRRRYFGCRTPANIAAAIAVVILLPTAIALLAVGTHRAIKDSNGALANCGCNFNTEASQLIGATGVSVQNAPVVLTFSCESVAAYECYRSQNSETYKNAIMAGIGAVLLVASLIPLLYFVTCSQRPDVAYDSHDQFVSNSAPFSKHVDAPTQQRIHQDAFNSSNV